MVVFDNGELIDGEPVIFIGVAEIDGKTMMPLGY